MHVHIYRFERCGSWEIRLRTHGLMIHERISQSHSGYPEQARIIRSAGVFGEVPIFLVPKPRSMAVEKGELSAAIVQVGVNIVLLSDGGEALTSLIYS